MIDSLSMIAEPIRSLAMPVSELLHDPANARKHSARNVAAIAASFTRFKQKKPLVGRKLNGKIYIVAGNGALEAVQTLGWSHVAVSAEEMTDAEATAYAIADNRTAELAEWDYEALQRSIAAFIDDESLKNAIGFSDNEIQALIKNFEQEEQEEQEGQEDTINGNIGDTIKTTVCPHCGKKVPIQ